MRKLMMCILMLSINVPVHAAPQWCYGTITDLLIFSDGSIMAKPSWRQDWIGICNLNTTWKDVPPVTCAAWYTTLKTAMTKQPLPQTTIYYPEASLCPSVPTYSAAPAPGYIMLQQ